MAGFWADRGRTRRVDELGVRGQLTSSKPFESRMGHGDHAHPCNPSHTCVLPSSACSVPSVRKASRVCVCGVGDPQSKSAANPALASATDWQEQVDSLAQCGRQHIAHQPCAEPRTTCSLRLPEDRAHVRNGSRCGGHTGLWRVE